MGKLSREITPLVSDPTLSEGRYIYNGNLDGEKIEESETTVRQNRKFRRRKHSTFNIVGAMFLFAVASLLYTGNVIAVNQLMKEIDDLTQRYNKIINTNEMLKAEVNRKSSLDRISKIATDELGLTDPKEAPLWFNIDEEKLEELEGR